MKFIKTFFDNLNTMFSYMIVLATAMLASVLSLYLLVDKLSLIYRFQVQGDLIVKAILVNIITIVLGATILEAANRRKRK